MEDDPFETEPFTVSCTIAANGHCRTYKALVDNGAQGYLFIDTTLAHTLCRDFGITAMPLSRTKYVGGFGPGMMRKCTHAIYPTIKCSGDVQRSAPTLMLDLKHHPIILGRRYLNRFLVDGENNRLWKKGDYLRAMSGLTLPPATTKGTPGSQSIPVPQERRVARSEQQTPPARSETATPTHILQRQQKEDITKDDDAQEAQDRQDISKGTIRKGKEPRLRETTGDSANRRQSLAGKDEGLATSAMLEEKSLKIYPIGAASYRTLAKKKENKLFSISMMELDSMVEQIGKEDRGYDSSINEISTQTLNDVRSKVPEEYHDLLDVFDKKKASELPPHREYDCKIELTGNASQLPKSRVYPLSAHKLKVMKEYITDMLAKGFITPSQAAHGAPILFAEKKDGSLRFCVDYRRLNQLTKKDRYPLPLIEETLAKVAGCKFLTKIDIVAAYNALRMHPDSESLTTFVTSLGAYKYRVMPFGLTGGPATWQHYINDILFEYLNDFAQAYMDDILIYSKTLKEHKEQVRKVLLKLQEAGLYADIKKCEFHVQRTSFLGVILTTDGIEMDPAKVERVVNWIRPSCLKQSQSFVGFCNFYRRFIRDFSRIARPLTRLAKKETPFKWSEDCEAAFQTLKTAITTAPVLRHFDRDREAILETDASDYVTAGVLSQYDDDGNLHPVAFYSKNLAPAECNYEIYDKELLAIIKAFEQWRPDLECTEIPIKVFTDHKSLEYFMTTKKLTRRQARWANTLAEFNFKIHHVEGRKNMKADALTRMADSRPTSFEDDRQQYMHQTLLPADRIELSPMMPEKGDLYGRVAERNKSDKDLNEVRDGIAEGKGLSDCTVDDNKVLRHGCLWVPRNMITEVVQEVHDQPMVGHPGIHRCLELIKRYFYWPGMKKSIAQYTRNCHTCQRCKAPRDSKNGLLHPLPIPDQRWKDIAMDLITGLPTSRGNDAILTVVDRLSKERHYIPCIAQDEGTSSEEIARILIREVLKLHGLPSTIVSDRGPQFTSAVWKALCTRLGIKSALSTAYHPETDGQTERVQQDAEAKLRAYCNYGQDNWADFLPMVEFADNNAVSSATGMSPFFFNKGFHPRMSFSPNDGLHTTTRERLANRTANSIADHMEDALIFGKRNVEVAQARMIKQANKKRKDVSYNIGDRVFLSTKNIKTTRPSKKLDYKMIGPYRISERVGCSYKLELPQSTKMYDTFHTQLLRKAANDPLPGQKLVPEGAILIDGTEEWPVDDILDSRRHYGRLQYRVNWAGFEDDGEWYNADDGEFEHAADVVEEFHKAHPLKPGPGNRIGLRKRR